MILYKSLIEASACCFRQELKKSLLTLNMCLNRFPLNRLDLLGCSPIFQDGTVFFPFSSCQRVLQSPRLPLSASLFPLAVASGLLIDKTTSFILEITVEGYRNL